MAVEVDSITAIDIREFIVKLFVQVNSKRRLAQGNRMRKCWKFGRWCEKIKFCKRGAIAFPRNYHITDHGQWKRGFTK